jgi:hypothetical protein
MNNNNRKRVNRKRYVEPRPVSLTLSANRSGFPDRFRTTLKYSEIVQVNPSQPFRNQVYRGNSVYDPDYTGAGHQPLYFDQYMLIYERYRVLGSKIIVKFINNSAGSSAIFVLHADTDPLALVSFFPISEQPHTKVSKFTPVSARMPSSLAMKKSSCEIMGLSRSQLWDDDYSGGPTSNPAKMWYYNIFINSADNTANLQGQLEIMIAYDVVFSDRIFSKESYDVKVLTDTPHSRSDSSPVTESTTPVLNLVEISSFKR